MKNAFKFYILFILLFFLFIPCTKVSAINMDLDYNTNTLTDIDSETTFNTDNNNSISNASNVTTSDSSYSPPSVTTTSSNDDFLTIENILSIIIIVIGIILIFLGIAIIIRCK